MSDKIVFYDISIASDHNPRQAFSPMTWKIRYALNVKKLDFDTAWLEYHEIEPTITKLGGKPTTTKPDGTPWYTLPVIYDPATKQVISDSRDIVEYLDKQYPTTQKLITNPTFETEWEGAILENVLKNLPLSAFMVLHNRASPPAARHIRKIREAQFGATLEALSTEEATRKQWEAFEEGMTNVSEYYKKAGTTFLSKEEVPMWADLIVGALVIAHKFIFGEDSKEWKRILEWDGGLWKRLSEALQVYEGEGSE